MSPAKNAPARVTSVFIRVGPRFSILAQIPVRLVRGPAFLGISGGADKLQTNALALPLDVWGQETATGEGMGDRCSV